MLWRRNAASWVHRSPCAPVPLPAIHRWSHVKHTHTQPHSGKARQVQVPVRDSKSRLESRLVVECSGVTTVSDTRGSNWGCHPLFFTEKKTGDLFSHHRLCQFCGVIPVYFHLFAHHCHFLLISLGCYPLEGVTRGGPPSLVTPLVEWLLQTATKSSLSLRTYAYGI